MIPAGEGHPYHAHCKPRASGDDPKALAAERTARSKPRASGDDPDVEWRTGERAR